MSAQARRLLVKACLNGGRRREEHGAVPLSPSELAREASAAVAAGAGALHVHPRLTNGAETLDPAACGAAIRALRAGCPGVPVGVTSGAWIEPTLQRRLALMQSWTTLPDFVSVNFVEEGATEVCGLLMDRGIGVEAGLWTAADAHALVASGLARRCLRILIEPHDGHPATSVATAAAIDEVLTRAEITLPRLYHGRDVATWAVLDAALDRGQDIRIGFEDTLCLPDNRQARNNAELVGSAVQMVRDHGYLPTC